MPRVRRAFSWRSKPVRLTTADLDELTLRNRIWRTVQKGKRDTMSAIMAIEANGQEAHEIPITARLKRPQLLRNRSLTFALTQTKQTRLLQVRGAPADKQHAAIVCVTASLRVVTWLEPSSPAFLPSLSVLVSVSS
jgi:hypothetical protein